MKKTKSLSLLTLCLACTTGVDAAVFTVGPAGTGCTHASVQAAVDTTRFAPGADQVRIVSGVFSNQAIVVAEQDVEIIGGYASCSAGSASGMTRLSGAGGKAAPVMSLYGSRNGARVRLARLELVEGDNPAGIGGGLLVHGRGEFVVTNTVVSRNVAGSGGGVAVIGTNGASHTAITLGDGVTISANSAVDGGGVWVRAARLRVTGAKTAISGNRAVGSSLDTGNGGGLFIAGDATAGQASADIDGGHSAAGLIAGNTASQRGGGLFVGAGADVRAFTSDPNWPLRVRANVASYGGGIHASGRDAIVTVWEGAIDANLGEYGGGGLFAANGATVRMLPARDASAPTGAIACAGGIPCNRLGGNRSVAGGFIHKNGAAVMLSNDDPSMQTHVLLDAATVSGHVGASVFADNCFLRDANDVCTHPMGLDIINSRIAPNLDAISAMHFPFATKASCVSCTIAGIRGNGFGGESDPVVFDTRGVLTLTQSIVWEPGREVVGALLPIAIVARNLIVHDLADFPLGDDVRADDPLFVDAALADYHLRAGSPALDAALNPHGLAFDLDGRPRVVDLVSQPDRYGALDLGPYERQP